MKEVVDNYLLTENERILSQVRNENTIMKEIMDIQNKKYDKLAKKYKEKSKKHT